MPRYFNVPFADKNKAKALGAWWDKAQGAWFAPHEKAAQALAAAGFVELSLAPVISVLPGEDRTFGGNALFVDLVPHSCWFTNVRYCVEPKDWERLSKGIYARAEFKCEVCASPTQPQAHERWAYDDEAGVQTLKRIICLCSMCHLTTHYGYAQRQGLEEQVHEHLKAINEWEDHQAYAHIANAFDLWLERSERAWDLDLSIIESAGIGIVRPVLKDDRAGIASGWLA